MMALIKKDSLKKLQEGNKTESEENKTQFFSAHKKQFDQILRKHEAYIQDSTKYLRIGNASVSTDGFIESNVFE